MRAIVWLTLLLASAALAQPAPPTGVTAEVGATTVTCSWANGTAGVEGVTETVCFWTPDTGTCGSWQGEQAVAFPALTQTIPQAAIGQGNKCLFAYHRDTVNGDSEPSLTPARFTIGNVPPPEPPDIGPIDASIPLGGSFTVTWTNASQFTDGTPIMDVSGTAYGWAVPSPTCDAVTSFTEQGSVPWPGETVTIQADDMGLGLRCLAIWHLYPAGADSAYSNRRLVEVVDDEPPPAEGLSLVSETVYVWNATPGSIGLEAVGTAPIGTPCIEGSSVNGRNAVASSAVQLWFSDSFETTPPVIVVGECQ